MKITDLDCELFIEDLGHIAGGQLDSVVPPFPSEPMTTLATGEESGMEPSFPFGSLEDLQSSIDSKVSDMFAEMSLPSWNDYQS